MAEKNYSLREIIALGLPRVQDWTEEQKTIIWENIINYFATRRTIPDEIQAINNRRFKLELAYDETFCRDVGIPYHLIDMRWNDIRAVIALWYFDNLSE